MEVVIHSHVHIVCSNESRNGKTLFARLYADCLSLGGMERLRIFDTDYPNGRLAHYFPANSEIVDLTKTGGQVRLFDTIVSEPNYQYVIDLQASLLDRFFKIFSDIQFDEGAAEAGISTAVYFIVDRSMSSIHAAEAVREKLTVADFVMVTNEAIGTLLHMPSAAADYLRIPKDRDLVLPQLSWKASELIEEPGFTFAGFIAGESRDLPVELRVEMWNFLEKIYNQRSVAGSGATLLL